jgi:glycosyltransferase involved in cell wall biosynthesis
LLKAGLYTLNCPDCCHEAEKLNSSKDFLDKNKRIYIRELPRFETVKAYHAADLFLFPSNIECSPIVLFECMASKTPFLVTDVGNSKEIIEWSGGGELLPTAATANGFCEALINESAIALERCYRHKELRDKKAAAGFLSWQNRFTWEKITKDYEEMYFKIIQ